MAQYKVIKESKNCFYIVKKGILFGWNEVGEDYFGSCFRYEFESKKQAKKAIRSWQNN